MPLPPATGTAAACTVMPLSIMIRFCHECLVAVVLTEENAALCCHAVCVAGDGAAGRRVLVPGGGRCGCLLPGCRACVCVA